MHTVSISKCSLCSLCFCIINKHPFLNDSKRTCAFTIDVPGQMLVIARLIIEKSCANQTPDTVLGTIFFLINKLLWESDW